jgi:hypothetical protein
MMLHMIVGLRPDWESDMGIPGVFRVLRVVAGEVVVGRLPYAGRVKDPGPNLRGVWVLGFQGDSLFSDWEVEGEVSGESVGA